jgi:hypothetical protein
LEANGGQDKAAILSIHALPFLFSFPTALTARSDVAFFCGLQSKSGYFMTMTSQWQPARNWIWVVQIKKDASNLKANQPARNWIWICQ